MTTQLLFYENPMPVSAERHAKTCVKAGDSFAFARSVNSVPLVASEFAVTGAEYPIVFAGEGDQVMPVVILGAIGTENAYVAEDGTWTGNYLPLFIRRYPFVFSHQTEQGQLVLHVDEAFEGVNKKGKGERLFDSDGAQTQYLKGVLRFLEDYQIKFNRTQQYCKRLVENDLLRPMEAQFTLPHGERRSLTGFKTVDRDKLKALDSAVLETMLRNEELECTFLHLSSLRHFAQLAQKLTGPKPDDTQGDVEATVAESVDS
jgi:hypothetical protein